MILLGESCGPGFGVYKFVPEFFAGIEPRLNGLGLIGRSFMEVDYRAAGGLKTIVGDCKNRRHKLRPVCVPYLNDVAVCAAVHQRKPVGPGIQDVAWYLDRLIEG